MRGMDAWNGWCQVGAISSGMPSTEEFVGRILHELYRTLLLHFQKITVFILVKEPVLETWIIKIVDWGLKLCVSFSIMRPARKKVPALKLVNKICK
jgi:hypothetical protein